MKILGAQPGDRKAQNGTPADKSGFVLTADGEAWFGPGAPMPQVAPAGTEPRVFDYAPLYNSYATVDSAKSRESDGITHTQLRQLAKQTLVRAAIETKKDKLSKVQWTFGLEADAGESKKNVRTRSQSDARVKQVNEFFRSPDGLNDFADWARQIFEDMLVIDAPALYVRPLTVGAAALQEAKIERNLEAVSLFKDASAGVALEVFDGATIRPLIDAAGREPREGEAFEQYIRGVKAASFTREEMIYAPRNKRPGKVYGFSYVEQVIFYINIALRRDITKLTHYTDGNIPSAIWPAPPSWSPEQIRSFQNSFDAYLTGNLTNRSRLMAIPGGGGTVTYPQLEALKDEFDEYLARIICFVFGIPVTSLVKEQNRATAETQRTQADEEGEMPVLDWFRRLLNRIIRTVFGFTDIVASPVNEKDVDGEKQAKIDEVYLKYGKVQVNELRERDGEEPIAGLDETPGFFSMSGFTPFETAIRQASAAADRAENPPEPVMPGVVPGRPPVPQKVKKKY